MSITRADINKIKQIVDELLRLMKVQLESEVSADVVGIKINLVGKDSGIIIGYHGETLGDLAYIISLIVRNNIDKDISVRVDAGGYLKEKDRKLMEIGQRVIEKVRRNGFPENITGINSYERRVIHTLVEKEGLISESTGFGTERKLVIKPRRVND